MSSFYDDASWVLIPSGIKEDVIYAQKPDSGLGDLVMTRASDATYTDSTGVVRRSPYNLLQQSEMFSNAIWTKTSSTIGIDATVAPNGTLTADLFTPANALSGRIDQVTGIAAYNNNIYTGSIYFKKPSSSISNITFYASDGNSAVGTNRIGVTIDLATFAATAYNFGNGVTTTVNVTAFGNNWYRASFTGSVSSGATGNWAFVARVLTVDGTINGTNGLFLWGAQLVEGSSALDYFPTTNRQDVPRIDFRNADGTLSTCGRLLLEPQRTNSIRNSSMVGAVAGTPGTLPTNWAVTSGGLTQTIVGTGTENGLPYIDLRFNGTATGASALVAFEGGSTITAANAQSWTNSFYFKTIAAPNPPVSYNVYSVQRISGSAAGAFQNPFTPTTTLVRYSQTFTTNNASVNSVQPYFVAFITIGQTYDFTIRIAAPQMELGAGSSSWIPTTTAAVTRLADWPTKTGVSSLIGQTEGTIYAEVNFNKNISGIIFSINDGTASNRIYIQFVTSTILIANIRIAGANLNFIATIPTIPAGGGTYKVALAYKQNDYVFSVNGTNYISTDARGVPPTNRIDLGQSNGAGQLEGGVTQAILYPTRLDNATLAQMTTL